MICIGFGCKGELRAPNEMGAGIAASPHCAERRIRRNSQLGPRGTQILNSGSPAQASHPINPLPPGEEPGCLYSSAPAEASLLFRAARPDPKVKADRCSAALLGMTSNCVPLCVRTTRRSPSAASRDRKIISSGASSRLATKGPEGTSHCLPRRSELWPPAAPSCRCRLSGEAWDRCPDHN